MLRLLLDENISGKVAQQLRVKCPSAKVTSLAEWENGSYLGTDDEIILAAAYEQALTLVTYDLRTIVPLAKSWAEAGRPHGGLIFVDVRSIAPNDFGGLVRALRSVVEEFGDVDWVDRVVYLCRRS